MASQSASRGQGAETRQPGRRNPRDLHESDFYSRSKKRERKILFKIAKKKTRNRQKLEKLEKLGIFKISGTFFRVMSLQLYLFST